MKGDDKKQDACDTLPTCSAEKNSFGGMPPEHMDTVGCPDGRKEEGEEQQAVRVGGKKATLMFFPIPSKQK